MPSPQALVSKLSELIRSLSDRDKKEINPYDIFGRSVTVDSTNLTYMEDK